MCRTFFWIGLTSYGGPAIVAQIRKVTLLQQKWLSEREFEEGLAFCQTLPGPIACQTAAHIGWRLHGGLGVFLALLFYDLPAFLLMLGLSWAYFRFGRLPVVEAVMRGLGAVVVAIVAESILSMGKPALKDWRGLLIAAAAGAGLFFGWGAVPVLLAAALAGILLLWASPAQALPPPAAEAPRRGGWGKTFAWVLLGAALFTGLVLATGLLDPSLPPLAWAMVKVNLLAFGGGYTAVALMYSQVVTSHAWLTPKEFVDGLALGQITPGPVIMTSTFIGYRLAGLAGAVVGTVCVFWPSALLLTLLAPQFERVRRIKAVASGVRGLLAAFIAMLFYVLWQVAGASLTGPVELAITVVALALLRLKVSPAWVILGTVILSAWALRG